MMYTIRDAKPGYCQDRQLYHGSYQDCRDTVARWLRNMRDHCRIWSTGRPDEWGYLSAHELSDQPGYIWIDRFC